MSGTKERILGAVTVMSEDDARKVWELIRTIFTLSNLKEEVPDDNETAAIKRADRSISEYGTIPHEAINWD